MASRAGYPAWVAVGVALETIVVSVAGLLVVWGTWVMARPTPSALQWAGLVLALLVVPLAAIAVAAVAGRRWMMRGRRGWGAVLTLAPALPIAAVLGSAWAWAR